ncbi:MAG: HIT domain-containing protein [Armatimonadetes bacterium]|nr:HIT domain-containing protein [Armatimonadota bacterium]
MDRIWAPWRMTYIEGSNKPDGCIFCDFPEQDRDVELHILHRGERAFVILNAYPYTNGHLMVAPYRHGSDLDDLTVDELQEMMLLTRRCVNALKSAFGPDGFNIGMNMGHVAGAGIADHLHMHIVPRWNGDTNFMAVCGDVRVVPQNLSATYERLLGPFAKAGAGGEADA